MICTSATHYSGCDCHEARRAIAIARLTAQVAYEQNRNANNVAIAKETCKRAFHAGMERAIGNHKDFEQTHPTFEEWWAKGEK